MSSGPSEVRAFLLTVEWRDTARGLELTLWASSPEHGPVCATFTGQEAVMFVPRHVESRNGRRVERPLKTKEGAPVDALYFKTQRALMDERSRIRAAGGVTLESDVKPSTRFTMERFLRGGVVFTGKGVVTGGVLRLTNPTVRAEEVTPSLRVLSLDIETDGWDGPVLSVALASNDGLERVFVARAANANASSPRPSPPREEREIEFLGSERAVLDATFAAIRAHDPDALLGWNVVDFDLRVLGLRAAALGLPFAIGRAGEPARVLEGDTAQSVSIARVQGRVVLDGVATLRNASLSFERYTLEHVAQTVLGRGKKIDRASAQHDALAEIRRMYRDEPLALAAYNLEDARLARDIFKQARLVEFLIARSKLTGLLLDRQGGSVAAFDYVYLPKLHRRGYVAGDVGMNEPMPSPGGHVLEGVPGLFTNVASFDFRSLYPSIIRTFQIDPLGLWVSGDDAVPGFAGASFAREGGLLPDIISSLHHERTRAREAGDETLSTAIKILMNSFYGVLGTPGCRFFDPRLASSITLRGHDIIERSRQFLEARGHQVLYGDTDSLFVRLDASLDEAAAAQKGKALAAAINAFWKNTLLAEHRLESHLELRFDALYLRFLMPTLRGSERGSKKRYAGLTRSSDGATKLVIRGLEAVRTDWTLLAREAQRELLERVFNDRPWKDWVLSLRDEVASGRLDEKLVYRKRLHREAYKADGPHVKAARQLAASSNDEGDESLASEIEYLMTVRGPQPLGHRDAPIDVDHYLEKQLGPALDVVLSAFGTSWDRLAGRQLQLFE